MKKLVIALTAFSSITQASEQDLATILRSALTCSAKEVCEHLKSKAKVDGHEIAIQPANAVMAPQDLDFEENDSHVERQANQYDTRTAHTEEIVD